MLSFHPAPAPGARGSAARSKWTGSRLPVGPVLAPVRYPRGDQCHLPEGALASAGLRALAGHPLQRQAAGGLPVRDPGDPVMLPVRGDQRGAKHRGLYRPQCRTAYGPRWAGVRGTRHATGRAWPAVTLAMPGRAGSGRVQRNRTSPSFGTTTVAHLRFSRRTRLSRITNPWPPRLLRNDGLPAGFVLPANAAIALQPRK